MSYSKWVLLALGVTAVGAGVGLSLAQNMGMQKLGKLEGEVSIVAWPGYIERLGDGLREIHQM
jgi:hypothetical protein